MRGIKQIKVDGTLVDLKREHLTLARAQELVSTGIGHSLIKLVRIPTKDAYTVGNPIMYVNEEGLLHDLEPNQVASAIAGQAIVGDVIIVENEESDFA